MEKKTFKILFNMTEEVKKLFNEKRESNKLKRKFQSAFDDCEDQIEKCDEVISSHDELIIKGKVDEFSVTNYVNAFSEKKDLETARKMIAEKYEELFEEPLK